MMLTQEQRVSIAAEATTWINTPYRGHSCVKGAGCDCGQYIYGVYRAVGLLPVIDLPTDYSLQVAQHRASTEYVDTIAEWFREIPEAEVQLGDIVVYKLGLAFAHAGIVMEWPGYILQADARNGVSGAHGSEAPAFRKAERKFFTLKDRGE